MLYFCTYSQCIVYPILCYIYAAFIHNFYLVQKIFTGAFRASHFRVSGVVSLQTLTDTQKLVGVGISLRFPKNILY